MANFLSRHAQPNASIVIVGAGVFGLGLAHELAHVRGYTNVTVLDRYLPPVPDGSSVDSSRIIRTEYADPLYARLAKEALDGWRHEYAPYYHECGFVLLTGRDDTPYTAKVRKERRAQHAAGKSLAQDFDADKADKAIKQLYPAVQAEIRGLAAMHNPEGGWADAGAAMQELARAASRAGVSFVTGKNGTVVGLTYDTSGKRVIGVKLLSEQEMPAAHVVLATGAWTNSLVSGVNRAITASSQPIGFVQLTPEEAAALASTPVMMNMTTGVFCFPPTPGTHVLKLARHGFGYATRISVSVASDGAGTAKQRVVSSPNLERDNSLSDFLPPDADEALRNGLRQFFPAFADRPWLRRRLCWYTETPTSDFVVSHHPRVDGLFFATGGSGHAFKFLPILGKYIADCFEGTASETLRQKWQISVSEDDDEMTMLGDGSRAGPPRRVLTREEQAKL
ncbi:Putative FAD dependent oxidoreductase, FAD/NAD(P)-binding domain superfamily, MTOX family [Colletotrichum destructivum]|uniref:FAD dependent oxidoreductase, FAD/NAD(P)-binding domain superfamily, MTOX family n=1 Tax=Colletotrichum destructivum TaxID=34406 RepID=A0AAX4IY39_9PEZI|nr:Putative FAD dependent oxidoreductase, FAD/NAD(P)-binding domain superfamily, MTOX family [Colletotrichum destructivum]